MIRSLIELLEGNRRWMARREAEDEEYFARHARGQSPAFLFIGCSDSRVPPTTITGTGPGELFVTRNIANLVRDDDVGVQSALEYALGPLGVEAQVESLERHPLVRRARKERPLSIYGSVYDLAEGRVRPLELAHSCV